MLKRKNEKRIYYIGFLSVAVVLTLWVLTFIFLKDYNDRGTFGDMFGVVNALFSGLAFAGIIFTILLQRQELKYQRDELTATREIFISQSKTLRSQKFESTFFGLLNLHNQIIVDFDYEKDSDFTHQPEFYKGRDVFKAAFRELYNELKEVSPQIAYKRIYKNHDTDFGQYFRNLYRIIKIIDETEFVSLSEIESVPKHTTWVEEHHNRNFNERYRYTSIVRAQLSDYELLIIFYNCLEDLQNQKFKKLIETYALLRNMPKVYVKDKELLTLYKTSAFEKEILPSQKRILNFQ